MIRAGSCLLLAVAAVCLGDPIAGSATAAEVAAKASKSDGAYPGLKYRMPAIMLVTVPDWPKDPAQQDMVAQFIKENGFNSVECQMDMLDCCRRNGIYARLGGDIGQMLAAAPKLKNDPAVFCYFISDRRRPKSFPGFAQIVRAFEKADPNHPTMFINRALWNQFPGFVAQVRPNLLSYYHYQWRSQQHPERNLVYLGLFRELALKNDIPLVRCTDARSTPPQLRQEHYTSLAYGVKGFHYSPCYHFGIKKNEKGEPILENGRLVQTVSGYAVPLTVIAREIRTMSPVLVKLNSIDVYHTEPLPLGGKKVPPDSWFGLSGQQLLVGVFKHEDGSDYLMPVNYDATAPHEATLRFKPDVVTVQRMDKKTGQWIKLALEKDSDHSLAKLTLAPGDGQLLKVVRSALPKPSPTVGVVLDRMLHAYRSAKSYRDEALIVIHIQSPMGDNVGDFDAKLEYQRPNLLRMEFEPPVMMDRELTQRLVIEDGKKIYAKSEGYDNQVVVIDAPQRNLADALFASKALGSLLSDGVINGSLVLQLLTSPQLPAPLDRASARLLERANLDGHSCDRIRFTTNDGNLTLWIDPQTSLVRQIELPTAKLLQELQKQGITGVEVAVEMHKAEFNPAIVRDRFAWKKTPGECYVRHLVAPPASDEATSKLLGQSAPGFQFTMPNGEKRTAASLSGKVTVIDFWATWCGWCLKGMPAVEEVRKKYAGNDKVQFFAISEDKPDVDNQQIMERMKQVKAQSPWARLSSESPDELNARFQFAGIPALIVLGSDGRVQYHHVGYDPEIKGNLIPIIDALLAGQDPAAKAVKAREAKLREYRRRLAEAVLPNSENKP